MTCRHYFMVVCAFGTLLGSCAEREHPVTTAQAVTAGLVLNVKPSKTGYACELVNSTSEPVSLDARGLTMYAMCYDADGEQMPGPPMPPPEPFDAARHVVVVLPGQRWSGEMLSPSRDRGPVVWFSVSYAPVTADLPLGNDVLRAPVSSGLIRTDLR